ncbi:hypothetical protein KKP04_01610 [Rhodomicrobium sp. Az07]|uniref:hypothetical protein n=1 Tax=Rhodomicrobium sp. Az07 TaxID=2839034 RepID=UPI001BED345B|nr:hypothetical protein [Rhodomicrobium sp. Az07]MBT3069567.1 hypothetical protein [Rhodomicrobium sp. Az07]
MPIRTAEDAAADLKLHLRPLATLMDEAHEEFQRECRSIAHKLETGSRASIYRDLIVRKLRGYCDATANATTFRKGQLVLVGLESKWILRVKRLRTGYSVAVGRTVASRQYDGNKMPDYAADLFPESPAPTCIYFGWSVSENDPGSINKYLVCNDEARRFAWALPLDDYGTPPTVTEELPLAPPAPTGEARRVRVKGERPARKANE